MLNVEAIIVSKMTSHCAGTVDSTDERRVRKRDKKVRRDVILDDSRRWRERVGGSDVRWKTVPQSSCCDSRQKMLMRQNVVVVWIQYLLVVWQAELISFRYPK